MIGKVSGEMDEAALQRVVAVPDRVRVLGDKCLFESGVARRRGPMGIDLSEVGRRSYQDASPTTALQCKRC